MNYKKVNQNGASSIMLAIFFVVIISILTIGYATLARREQKAVLDKTLSNQAQYTAESGINAVRAYVDKTLAAGGTPGPNPNCVPNTTENSQPYYVGTNFVSPAFDPLLTEAKLTCLTWDTNPTEVSYTLKQFGGNTSFNNKNNVGYFKLTWSTKDLTGIYSSIGDTKMPDISADNKSIIKLVTGMRKYAYSNTPMFNTAYLVPTNAASVKPVSTTPSTAAPIGSPAEVVSKYVDLGNSGGGGLSPTSNQDGTVYYVPCDSAGSCTVYLGGLNCPLPVDGVCSDATYKDRLFYLQNLGAASATVTYQSIADISTMGSASEQYTTIDGVAVKVDSNAISGGMSKRLVAYLSIDPESWQPWFAVMGNNLCKDYILDGDQNSSPAMGGAGCP